MMETMPISLLVAGAGLAIAIVASPGAVTAQVVRLGLQRGFMPSFVFQIGALIGLLLWAVIAFAGIELLSQSQLLQLGLGIVGGVLLLYLARDALRTARASLDITTEAASSRGDFTLGLGLSLANPLPLAVWLGFGNTITGTFETASDGEAFVVFLVGFTISALLWAIALSGFLNWGKRFVTARLFHVIGLFSGLLLALFGLRLLWISLNTFVG